jgi:hypothetical protein
MMSAAYLQGFLFHFYFQLCSLLYVSLQRYTKSVSTLQRASLVEKSRPKPNERMKVLSDVGVFAELWKVLIVFIVFSTSDLGSVILTVFSTVPVEIGAANKDRMMGCL